MKAFLFKNHFFAFALMSIAALSFVACDNKDEETPEPSLEVSLVGTWDINSYQLDDDEWMGLIAESAFITFEEPVDSSGIFIQEVTFADGETVSLSSRYIISEIPGQIIMYYEGEPIVVDIDITGNKMLWESIQQQYPLVIKATKRQ
jgi:hypothetical protein